MGLKPLLSLPLDLVSGDVAAAEIRKCSYDPFVDDPVVAAGSGALVHSRNLLVAGVGFHLEHACLLPLLVGFVLSIQAFLDWAGVGLLLSSVGSYALAGVYFFMVDLYFFMIDLRMGQLFLKN